jgi:4'-phosphopantetheinyl transferase
MPVAPSQHSAAPASTVAAAATRDPLAPKVYWTVAEALAHAAAARLAAELSAAEVQQAQRFHFEEDRAAYVAAHAMLRRVLRTHLGGGEPCIIRNPLGRPELAPGAPGGPAVSFNLTHSRGFAACAVLDGAAVGIDAEDVRRPIDTAEMAARWYAPSEQLLLERLSEPCRTEMFFRIWTLKEAILKTTGHGLRIEPPLFAVDPEHGRAVVPEGLGIPTCWRLAEMTPLPYIRLALAVPGQGPLAPSVSGVDLG